MSKEKREKLEKIDPSMPVDEMPDCFIKYDKIVKEAKEQGKLFTDNQFKANNESLGEHCLNRGVT